MSNKSRARNRVVPDPEPVDTEDEARMKRVEEALSTPGRAGLDKMVRLVMDARNKPEPARPDVDPNTLPDYRDIREPSPYEVAVLRALGSRQATRPLSGGRREQVLTLPVEQFSGQTMYEGTVEPWRVEERRARNRRARAARRRNRKRANA